MFLKLTFLKIPLMEACRFKKFKNIESLFQMYDLNYLYVNKKGEDTLKIANNYSKSEKIKLNNINFKIRFLHMNL